MHHEGYTQYSQNSQRERKKERENNGGYYTLIFLKNGVDNGVHLTALFADTLDGGEAGRGRVQRGGRAGEGRAGIPLATGVGGQG